MSASPSAQANVKGFGTYKLRNIRQVRDFDGSILAVAEIHTRWGIKKILQLKSGTWSVVAGIAWQELTGAA